MDEPGIFEGVVYRSSSAWAFKICRSGCEELARQDDFPTRVAAQDACRLQLAAYDQRAVVVNQYKVRATIELTVEGDTLAEAEAVAEQEFHHISESLDALWWSRNGASRYSLNFTQHPPDESP